MNEIFHRISIRLKELAPLFVLVAAAFTIIIIPLKITSLGYLPPDDSLRHSAKVISQKEWSDILVMRGEIKMDRQPGWHSILSFVHRLAGCDQDGLLVFSVVFLFIIFCIVPLFFLRYPEAWLITLLIITVFGLGFMQRLLLGRPFILPAATTLLLCFTWQELLSRRTPYKIMALFALSIAISSWAHGGWYLFVLPVISFFIARQWRAGIRLSISTLSGIVIGAFLTSHPVLFLKEAIVHMGLVMDSKVSQTLLVNELQPFNGDALMIIVVCGLALWRHTRKGWDSRRIDNPVFILAALGWVLGFFVVRFWLDWGFPALAAWIAFDIQDMFKNTFQVFEWRRVCIAAAVAGTLFLSLTSDIGGRWTYNLHTEYLSTDNPKLAGWLPEPGGIIYSNDMGVFFQTFFKNPKAPWRYMLGCESAWMPPEDLAILRKIQWNYGAYEGFEPWVKKMRREDRLIIRGGAQSQPKIPGLEWYYAVTNTWIGKLPRGHASKKSE